MFEKPIPPYISLGRILTLGFLIVLGNQITTRAQTVYQMRSDFSIWKAPGTACTGDSCPTWTLIENNSSDKVIVTAFGAGGYIYQLRKPDGAILRSNGQQKCTDDGKSCPGWVLLDQNPLNTAITASVGTHLYKLQSDAGVYSVYSYKECTGNPCEHWQMLDRSNDIKTIVAGPGGFQVDPVTEDPLYALYQLRTGGKLLVYAGKPCSGTSCTGWQLIDNNPSIKAITAGVSYQFYKLHNDGSIWQFPVVPCASETSCPAWIQLHIKNPNVQAIAAYGFYVYGLQNNRKVFRYPCSSGESCAIGDALIGGTNTITSIVPGFPAPNFAPILYYLSDGKVMALMTEPCSDNKCPTVKMLDNTATTRVIVAN